MPRHAPPAPCVFTGMLACAVAALVPVHAAAQPVVADAVASADALYFSGEALPAYELLQSHLETHPNDYEALWRAARAAVVIGIVREGITAQNEYLDPAIVLGDRAVAERPQGIDGLYWRGAAEGRRALNAGNDYASRLVQRVFDDAHAILALDSLHAGAHNLLGRVNYEVMDLSRVERFMARMLVSNQAIRESSWESAALHLRRAAELDGSNVLYWLDLGQLYMRRGRDQDAVTVLHRVTEMHSLHPPDDVFKDTARRWLQELESQ